MEKRIEVCDVCISDLHDKLGNPRKITAKKKKELQDSMDQFGDFGIIVIDENNNIISGHQRVDALRETKGNEAVVHCKKLIGYTKAELKAINIKANTHAGEWDLNKLAEWTGELTVKLGLEIPNVDANEREIKEMEPMRYEKYDYVMIVCRTSVDYQNLIKVLELEGKKTVVGVRKDGSGKISKRKIRARAIWYDEFSKLIKKNLK